MTFKSPLRYPGGKQKAIKFIAPLLPAKVGEYREPFVGGGSVYFHAKSVGMAERYRINDLFGDLIAFWKTAQDPNTNQRLRWSLSRLHQAGPGYLKSFYHHTRRQDISAKSIFDRAGLFFFYNRVSFSGTTQAGGMSAAAGSGGKDDRFTPSAIQRLASMPEALKDTRITCWGYDDHVFGGGLNNDVFLFCDPPYWTAKKLYGPDGKLHEFDHARLADSLRQTKHRFLMTYDDCPQIRALYPWANVREWSLQYGMNNCSASGESKKGAELFISNY